MATLGSVEPFDLSTGEWASYASRMDQYMKANKIDAALQPATMLTIIGGASFDLLRDLLAPDDPADKSYAQLKTTLTDHLSPKPLVIGERYRFYQRDQRQGESVAAYVGELRRLSRTCDFGDHLKEALRDRFVCGLRSTATRRKLLTTSGLTFDQAVRDAKADELAVRDAVEVSGSVEGTKQRSSEGPASVHSVRPRYPPRNKQQQASSRNNTQPCFRCGSSDHAPDSCRFIEAECRSCHKRGHLQKVCRSKPAHSSGGKPVPKPRRQRAGVHQVSQPKAASESLFASDEEPIHHVRIDRVNSQPPAPIMVTAAINDVNLEMEVDTGAAVSLLPTSLYQTHFPSHPLRPSKLQLSAYSGDSIQARGVLSVTAAVNGKTERADLYVVDTRGPPLLGREWLMKFPLDWTRIKHLRSESAGNVPEAVLALKEKYADVFSNDQGCLRGVQAKLQLQPGAQPKFVKARQMPLALKPKVEAEIRRMVDAGILTPVTWSDWATPVVPVPKPNGTVRLCGDFKVTVNPQLRVDQHPLPLIEDIFASLSGGQKFTKLDLKAAYTQMEMDDKSKPLLTLNTHLGLFQLNRLAYGVASAPALWQRAMDVILKDIPRTECTIDDIILTGTDDKEHLASLEKVLQRLSEAGLRVNPSKCTFFQDQVEYCGHVISSEGLHTLPSKVEAIGAAPAPTDVSQVRSFIGLVTYYQRFIPKMSTILSPITALLQKDKPFCWTAECDAAFQEVKQILASKQVLTHYDAKLSVRLASDASPYGLGAVLSHVHPSGEERPIAYASRKLTDTETRYSQIDKEALSIVWSVKKFHNYLYGRKFELLTDHQPLVSIFSPVKSLPVMTAARLQRYAMFLAGHNYEIVYRNTRQHCNADGLSRLPSESGPVADRGEEAVDVFYASLMEQLPLSARQITATTRKDPVLSRVLHAVQHGWPVSCGAAELQPFFNRRKELSSSSGCILWGNRVVIPTKHRADIVEELHEGHPGIVRMKALARSHVYWPGIDEELETKVRSCPGCQRTQHQPAKAPLHPWVWPEKPWHRVHIDFLGPLRGFMWLVIVDAHSKWPEVLPFRSTTATATANSLRTVFARYGCPDEVVSDNGPQFTAEEFQSFLRANGIRHRRSAPYHPATNGLAERFVQSFKRAINSTPTTVPVQEAADKFLMKYRSTVHPTTGESPDQLFLGRSLRTRLSLLHPSVQSRVHDQQETQQQYHGGRTLREFPPSSSVMVRDYRDAAHHTWAPATVTERTGPTSYTVQTNEGGTWRRHVDQINPGHQSLFRGRGGETTPSPPTQQVQDYNTSSPSSAPNPPGSTVSAAAQAAQPSKPMRRSQRVPKPVDRMNL